MRWCRCGTKHWKSSQPKLLIKLHGLDPPDRCSWRHVQQLVHKAPAVLQLLTSTRMNKAALLLLL
eukprot:1159880-Pelagomonas_calceolata.AAC.8